MWFLGGDQSEGPGCFMFAQWSSWAPDLVDYVQRVGNAMATKTKETV